MQPEHQHDDDDDEQMSPNAPAASERSVYFPPFVSKALKTSGFHFFIPVNDDEVRHVHFHFGHKSWRAHVLKWLHDKRIQFLLIGLLLLDVVLLFTELFLSALFPPCQIITRDAISCCPASAGGDQRQRWLASENLCEAPLQEQSDYETACDTHKHHTVHEVEHVMFIITICILSVFMVEILLLIFALTPCTYFRHFFYALDCVVVTTSLSFEVAFHVVHKDDLAFYLGMVVFARCWRFVRIGHGLVEATAEITSQKYTKIVSLAEELNKALEEQERKEKNGEISDAESLESIRDKNKELVKAILESSKEPGDSLLSKEEKEESPSA